jgi:hypothetical protein
MTPRARSVFLALIVAQAAHSVEEFRYRLYDVFAPAGFVSTLVSSDPRRGFAIANLALVLFGVWCYVARVRPNYRSAAAFAWGWAVLELVNGLGHITFTIERGGYFQGVVTAPFLLMIAAYLMFLLAAGDASPGRG